MSNNKIISKKLKAIVFTDIVNFTQISAEDEKYASEISILEKEAQTRIIKAQEDKVLNYFKKMKGKDTQKEFKDAFFAKKLEIENPVFAKLGK